MLFQCIVTLLAVTGTTDLAAQITSVKRFLPALAPKRIALIGAMDEELVARQMDECTSFCDHAWAQYWSDLAFSYIDDLDRELGRLGLPSVRKYIQGDQDASLPLPEIYAYLGRGTTLLQNTPLGSSSKAAEMVKAAPAEQRGPIMALDAALKATAYLFQAAWPGGTPKRNIAYSMSSRMFDIILDACTSPLGMRVIRHTLASHGEEVTIYGLVPTSTKTNQQPAKDSLAGVLMTNGLEGTNAESIMPFLRCGRLGEVAWFFMEMPGTYAYKAPMSLGVTDCIYADAISFVQSLEFVDSNRVGMMGLSFGAHWATRMAIRDKRLKAMVANGAPLQRSLSPSAAFGMPQIMIEALSHAAGANAMTVSTKLKALAPSRDELRAISCHVLAINGDSDTLVDAKDTVELAELAPNSCLKLYQHDDHCAMAHAAEWLNLSIDWMKKHLVTVL